MAMVCGIDWAVDPKKRAAVVLETMDAGAAIQVREIVHPVSDAAVSALCAREALDVVGVDTPFGWPAAFVKLVHGWSPGSGRDVAVPNGANFAYRLTDQLVYSELRKRPLSVSSDRIALGARAWLQLAVSEGLVSRFEVGAGHPRPPGAAIIEVYPAATLIALYPRSGELGTEGYKKDPEIRQLVLNGLIRDLALEASQEQQARLVSLGEDSDKLDALLAALTAVFYLGKVEGWTVRRPGPLELGFAQREGWIFFPSAVECPPAS